MGRPVSERLHPTRHRCRTISAITEQNWGGGCAGHGVERGIGRRKDPLGLPWPIALAVQAGRAAHGQAVQAVQDQAAHGQAVQVAQAVQGAGGHPAGGAAASSAVWLLPAIAHIKTLVLDLSGSECLRRLAPALAAGYLPGLRYVVLVCFMPHMSEHVARALAACPQVTFSTALPALLRDLDEVFPRKVQSDRKSHVSDEECQALRERFLF